MESPTKLFTSGQIKKFFGILDKLQYSIPSDKINYPWKDYQTIYTKDSDHCPSERQVFVHRTINKWLKGKFLILYKQSELGVTYKQFVSLTTMSYHNDWSNGYINVGLVDYANPYAADVFGSVHIELSTALRLEGEWCDNSDIHHKISDLISIGSVVDREYVFKAIDWGKYIDGNNLDETLKLITTTKSFIAKTEYQAYELKDRYMNKNKNNDYMIGDLIGVK